MKTKMDIKKIAVSFTISTVLNFGLALCTAHAQATGSHGGDARCQEFYSLASEMSIDLAKIGQSEISSVNPLINVLAIRAQIMKPLEVLPAHNLPRQALSNPTLDKTDLDVEQWETLSKAEKVKLVLHEMMVLIQAEGDGEYLVSQDAGQLLFSKGYISNVKNEKVRIFESTKSGRYDLNRMEENLLNQCQKAGYHDCTTITKKDSGDVIP